MNTVGLYIASISSLGNGTYRLNDCWVEDHYDEISVGDIVIDNSDKVFEIINYQGYPQRAQENLWIEVKWPDYPNTDIAPLDNSSTQNYDSTIGSAESNEFSPEVAYRCRIASSANSYPAYHYAVVLTDAKMDDPGAREGAVGDYLMDSTGQIFEVIEWNGWEQTTRVKDIEEREHATDGSSRPFLNDYAQFYRPTVEASVLPQGDISILGDDALDDAISFSNTEIWRHRGIELTKDTTLLDNVTSITIGDGLSFTETAVDGGWGGGKIVELEASLDLSGTFTSTERYQIIATASQVVFYADYAIGFVDVYMNGFKLAKNYDFYANNGTEIYLDVAAEGGDVVDIIAYDTFSIANHYTVAQTDSSFVSTTGNTIIDGELTANAFNLSSARILKENIAEFTVSGLDIINNIDVMAFNYKSDPEKLQRIGFIADDTDQVLAGPNQNYFDIGNTVGVLLKAVQELSARIEELEDKNDE